MTTWKRYAEVTISGGENGFVVRNRTFPESTENWVATTSAQAVKYAQAVLDRDLSRSKSDIAKGT